MMPSLFVCLPLLFYCVLPLLPNLVIADPPYTNCSNPRNSNASTGLFLDNLDTLLGSLTTNASASKYHYASSGNFPDKVYGNYMCLNYVTNKTCQDCIATAVQSIVKLCPNTKEAIVWEEECQLRYSDKEFFGELDVTGSIGKDNVQNISQPEQFSSVLVKILKKLTDQASFNISLNKYATGEVKHDGRTIYALVQCTQDLSNNDCNRCLQSAINNTLAQCYSSIGARLLSRSCYLRYELYHFYQGESGLPGSSAVNNNSTGSSRRKILMIVISVVSSSLAMVLLSSFIYYFWKQNGLQKSLTKTVSPLSNNFSSYGGSKFHFQMSSRRNEMGADEFPYIDLQSLCEATENFSDSKLLGQGGFGPVYKGILSDGKEVAIKRLSTCSDQGSEEFINEVLLIKQLQHKNLVRLLGFCVDGEEKLLVYEFMPNSSLDCFLFDPVKRAELHWSRRIEIISGIAKGILYLNEDSRLKIIHRDLKASNILLDNDMNPKISDFGMARIFAGSDGEANTVTIVGTYGYMAPEYAMEGLYSIKSDVFSFGVLFLEIITGKRNAGFYHSKQAPSLLAYAWQLWTEGNGLELMDPLLSDSCNPDEFLKYMNIGLLCVQDDARDRPTMSSVVSMLRSETTVLSQPQRPPFCVGRFVDDNANLSTTEHVSVNGLTISQTIAR